MTPSLKDNIEKCFSETETVALLEQDNDKDDILLKEAEHLVKRQKTKTEQNKKKTQPPNLWKRISHQYSKTQ